MPWRFVLDEPPLGTVRARCGHCELFDELSRYKVTAFPVNLPGKSPTVYGEVVVCPTCKEASKPAGWLARTMALLFFVPSTAALLYGVARGTSLVWDMVRGVEPVAVGKIALALAMIPFGGFLSYRALKLVIRAVTPLWFLPLKNLTDKPKA